MIIDAHVHIQTGRPREGKEYFPKRHSWISAMHWAYGGLPPYRNPEDIFPRIEEGFSDPEGTYTIASMDQAGVDACWVFPIDYGLGMGEEPALSIEEKHQHLAQLQERYPGRLFCFAGPDPRRPGAVEIFERAIKEYGLKGLKVIPHNGYYPWDRSLYPLYERCLEWGLPVVICTMFEFGGHHRLRFNEPMHVADVIADFPDLTIVLLHAGYPLQHWFEECLHVAALGVNTYLEFDFWVYGYRQSHFNAWEVWPNVLNQEEKVVSLLARAKSAIGAQRILFGTDSQQGPRWHGERSCYGFGWRRLIEWWKGLPQTAAKYGYTFTQEEVDLMLGGNAARIMGLEKDPRWQRKHRYGFVRRTPEPFLG